MAYPAITELPDTVEIRSENRPRTDGETVTNWRIYFDGQREVSGYYYTSHDKALEKALRTVELQAVNAVVEEAIGQERHYGIVVTSETAPNHSTLIWKITDPHTGQKDYAFAWYSHNPPPVSVYTRAQYETACAALELEPAADTDLGNYGDRWGDYDLFTYTPRVVITADLRRRRMAGLERERAAKQAEATLAVEAEVGTGPYSREQYERACQIMGVPVLSDGGCMGVIEQDLTRLSRGGVLIVGVPDDQASVELAYRRANAIEQETVASGRRCGECGTPILKGAGMAASMGLACDVPCFDAMADRPGRYDTRQA
jgi:hypothetical protein